MLNIWGVGIAKNPKSNEEAGTVVGANRLSTCLDGDVPEENGSDREGITAAA